MMARKRDYKAEYRRRIARGKAIGLSKAQARGHPRKGEPLASSPAAKPKADEKVVFAIRAMHGGASMTAAARQARMSPTRLSKFIKAHRVARLKGRNWIMTDRLKRQVPIIVGASTKVIVVGSFKDASLVAHYHNAVGQLARGEDWEAMARFDGKNVTDHTGKIHRLETDPNALIRYALKDEPEFHEIYKVIAA